MRKMRKICEVEGCANLARYGLYNTFSDGTKKWLHVCPLHEQQIGDENMRLAGGRYEERR